MLYIHIPFCKSRCIYCNFFSSTLLSKRKEYIEAVIKQLPKKKTYSTIYLGGGTPSMIENSDLEELLNECRKRLNSDGEFTIECNPDDVDEELAALLHRCGVNRVSLGIQTFNNERLKLINRRHTAEKARKAVALLRAHGIYNVSIDLMFGFPQEKISDWKSDITEAIALKPTHISAYCLSVEEGTQLHRMLNDGRLPKLPTDEELEEQYYTLCKMLKDAGYVHYEISNFSMPGYPSRHNSGYWQDKTYDAVGAGAYGYNKENCRRYWNVADIEEFISRTNSGQSVVEDEEVIDDITHYNDLITTALRTNRGLSLSYVKESCTPPLYDYLISTSSILEKKQLVEILQDGENKRLRLSPNKLFVSDDILSELIFIAN